MTILILFLAIALQIFLTFKKVSPFLSLLVVAVITGICLGLSPQALLQSIRKGAGDTLGSVALIVCLGAALGRILEAGGATERISSSLINAFGQRRLQWAMTATGFLIGIPLYYNAGFIILVPLVFTVARKAGLPVIFLAISMAASLSVTHCFLPPHPGPAYLVNTFGKTVPTDMGRTLVYGLLIGLPTVVIAGPLFASTLKKMQTTGNPVFTDIPPVHKEQVPGTVVSFLIALLPVLLISLAVIAEQFLADGWIKEVFLFTGDSTLALLLAVLVATAYFTISRGYAIDTAMKWLGESISGIAMILLIITAGGVFKQVIQDSGTDLYIAGFSRQWNMHPLLFGWLITALLRVAVGSATVSGITAAGIVTPLLLDGQTSPELMALAVGAGSVFGSHVNDTGFWMFKEFFGLSLKQTFLSWTVMEIIISLLGLIGVLLLDIFV